MDQFTTAQKIAIWIIPIIFAVTLHEAAHGYVASKLGDDTALKLGRVTLNPFKHIDPLGTVIIPLLMMATTGFIFGWAKPVPVNPHRLYKPKRDFALVGLAGPFANLLMALAWVLLLKIGLYMMRHQMTGGLIFTVMCGSGVTINLVLMVLNLVPIPPLDGSRFITFLLPAPLDRYYNQIPPMVGIILIVALLMSGILTMALKPIIDWLQIALLTVFNIQV